MPGPAAKAVSVPRMRKGRINKMQLMSTLSKVEKEEIP